RARSAAAIPRSARSVGPGGAGAPTRAGAGVARDPRGERGATDRRRYDRRALGRHAGGLRTDRGAPLRRRWPGMTIHAELGLADQSGSVAKNAVEHSSAMSITP